MSERIIPGEVLTVDGEIALNAGRSSITIAVENAGDRPIQVGSHYHFAAANPLLTFDRTAAHGYRLDIPAGTSVRFEPGVPRTVGLVAIGGRRVIPGLRPESAGPLDVDQVSIAADRLRGSEAVSGDENVINDGGAQHG